MGLEKHKKEYPQEFWNMTTADMENEDNQAHPERFVIKEHTYEMCPGTFLNSLSFSIIGILHLSFSFIIYLFLNYRTHQVSFENRELQENCYEL